MVGLVFIESEAVSLFNISGAKQVRLKSQHKIICNKEN